MPVFEVQTPDGRIFDVEAPDMNAAAQAAQEFASGGPAQPRSSTQDFLDGTGAFNDPVPMGAAPPQSAAPSIPQQLGRALQTNVQGVGRGLANLAGMPADLAGAAVDLGLAGAQKGVNMFRDEPVELPRLGQMPMGSQHLKDSASEIMRAIGIDPISREQMSPTERLHGDVLEFGTEAGAAGKLLSDVASRRFPQGQTAGVKPGALDGLLQPYIGRGSAPIATDIAAGMGSGAGYNYADENFPDSDAAKLIGMLAGGVGGAALSDLPGMVGGVAGKAAGFAPSDVPYGAGGATPTSRRVVQHTRNMLEEQATDSKAARDRVAERMAEAERLGEPMPTTGIASDDIGMIALERGSRTRNTVPFEEADQLLVDAAQERISGLRDPGADQSAVAREIQQRPEQLAADRDAAALPLLRQAEQSGAVVDPQPVVDVIDGMLKEAKRPPVVSALTDARRMLNAAGTDQLDTSVSGLYETRKAINDIIEGRSETPTGRYAKKELIEVRDALDTQIKAVAPEFGQYLDTYKAGSRPLDIFGDSRAVAKLAETDPRNVAKQVLSGAEYGTEGMLKEIHTSLKNNPEALRGWKAAVADVLVDKVTNTNTALTRTSDGPVSIAKLQQVWKQHEKDLAQIFAPDEMAAANRAHKLLEPLGNLSRKSIAGSPTAMNQQLVNAMEAGILAYTGNAIKTGMIMKRLRVAANLLPGVKDMTLEAQMGKFVERMWFDPELFVHVMDKPVREMERPQWNAKLNRLIAGTEFIRADPEEDDEIGAIMRGSGRRGLDEDMERAINGN